MQAKGVMRVPYKNNINWHSEHEISFQMILGSWLSIRQLTCHRRCAYLPGKGPGIKEEALEDRALPEGHTQGEAVTGEGDVEGRSRSANNGGLQRGHIR